MAGLLVLQAAWAGEVPASHAPQTPGVPLTLAPGLSVEVGLKVVRMEASICLQQGILEYIVCRPGTFEHESICVTPCKPSLLHAALMLIGLAPQPYAPGDAWPEQAWEHAASRLAITVEWQQQGTQRRRLCDLLVHRERQDRKAPDRWIFAGSYFYQGEGGGQRYAADLTGAVIGLTPAGAAVVQFGEQAGIPYRGDDQGLEIDAAATPAVGTPVRLLFSPQAGKELPAGAPKP